MAGVNFTCTKGAITLTASTAVTLMQIIAATNVRVQLKDLDISFNGITPTDPGILVEVLVQTSAGTMSSLTPGKVASVDTETLNTTAQHTASAEPSASTILWSGYVNEQTGWEVPWPVGFTLPIIGGTRMGIRATPGTLTATTKAAVVALCEE